MLLFYFRVVNDMIPFTISKVNFTVAFEELMKTKPSYIYG